MHLTESLPVKQVTVSIGAAFTIPQRGDSGVALIDIADKALYEAKRLGKNRLVMGGRPVPTALALVSSGALP